MRNSSLTSILLLIFWACDGSNGPDTAKPQQLVFSSTVADGNVGLFVVNDDGSGRRRITTDSIQAFAPAALSPDGNSILFSGSRRSGTGSGVWRVNRGDSAAFPIVDGPAYSPCWSLDGSRFFFSSTRSGHPSLWSCTIFGTDLRQLVPDSLYLTSTPTHSPVRPLLVFGLYLPYGSSYRGRIALLNYVESTTRIIGPDSLVIDTHDFAWSPSGDRFAFAAINTETPGYRSLYVIDTAGTQVRQLTEGHYVYNPDWSPVHDEIVYYSQDGIRIVNVATGVSRVLTSSLSTSSMSEPVWSPDGEVIAVATSVGPDPPSQRIYLIPRSTGQPLPASDSPYSEIRPRWMKLTW